MNHALLCGSLKGKAGFDCQENNLLKSRVTTVHFSGGGIEVWGCFSDFRPGLLVPVMSLFKATDKNTFS